MTKPAIAGSPNFGSGGVSRHPRTDVDGVDVSLVHRGVLTVVTTKVTRHLIFFVGPLQQGKAIRVHSCSGILASPGSLRTDALVVGFIMLRAGGASVGVWSSGVSVFALMSHHIIASRRGVGARSDTTTNGGVIRKIQSLTMQLAVIATAIPLVGYARHCVVECITTSLGPCSAAAAAPAAPSLSAGRACCPSALRSASMTSMRTASGVPAGKKPTAVCGIKSAMARVALQPARLFQRLGSFSSALNEGFQTSTLYLWRRASALLFCAM